MNPLKAAVRWYRLHVGRGREMLECGAELKACPHCRDRTPVYRSAYDDAGNPVTFTQCLWCEGLIEYHPAMVPRAPYDYRDDRELVDAA